jgi:hypothetical protein
MIAVVDTLSNYLYIFEIVKSLKRVSTATFSNVLLCRTVRQNTRKTRLS